jgi:hypothetical protein
MRCRLNIVLCKFSWDSSKKKNRSIAFRRWFLPIYLMIIWIIIPLLQNIEMLKIFFDNLPKMFVLTNVDDKMGCNVTKYSG